MLGVEKKKQVSEYVFQCGRSNYCNGNVKLSTIQPWKLLDLAGANGVNCLHQRVGSAPHHHPTQALPPPSSIPSAQERYDALAPDPVPPRPPSPLLVRARPPRPSNMAL